MVTAPAVIWQGAAERRPPVLQLPRRLCWPAGGLGDVMQALPKALAARGHRVMVVAPRYREYDDAWDTGVRLRLRCFDSNQEASVGQLLEQAREP